MKLSERLELFADIASDESHNRVQFLDTMRFYNGEQWPEGIMRARLTDPNGPRPCLVSNVLPHHVKQVTNEMRQMRPSVRVVPVDDNADVETAKVLQGIIRHIENRSDADVVYMTGGRNAVISGFGYWRIISEYIDEEYGQQELCLRRILNPLTVYMSRCDDLAGSDAEDVFVTTLVPRSKYKGKLPRKVPKSISTMGTGDDTWLDDDYIRLAEHYHVEHVQHKAVILTDGRRVKAERVLEMQARGEIFEINDADAAPIMQRKVTWTKFNAVDIMDERDQPGKWIPVVRVIGQELDVEGKRFYYGMVRDAMDPQRMRNYWRSTTTEMIALAPKAPVVGYAGQFDGFEDRWAKANIQNIPYLEVNAVDINGERAPLPQRQPAVPMPSAMMQAAQDADWDVKATTGIFGAGLGEPSAEKSGKAIIERKAESDVGTYDYIDNLSIAIRHTGRILVDLIPHTYDTPRVQRILGEDNEPKMVRLDPTLERAHVEHEDSEIEGIYNPGVGRYDVEVTVGPSYATKRSQAAENMAQILQGNPQLWQAAGDIFAENLDWPGADRLAERLKRMVPPELKGEDEQEGEEQQQIPPEVQQTIAQMDAAIQGLTAELEKAQSGEAKAKADDKRLSIEAYKAETERMRLLAEKPSVIPLWQQLGLMDNQDITPDAVEAALIPTEQMPMQEGEPLN
jgi:hypothetical protein